MAERFTIVVMPPGDALGELTVGDAMRQVLDAVELLNRSSEDAGQIVWSLVSASTNSPFTVVGEARGRRPGVDVAQVAKREKRAFAQNCKTLQGGIIPEQWRDADTKALASGFIARSRNGIASTTIHLETDNVVSFTQKEAQASSIAFIEPEVAAKHASLEIEPRIQFGSIEGVLIRVEKNYNVPAIQIRERLTGDTIWCHIDDEHRQLISQEANFDDVWANRRVRISGRLHYDKTGRLSRVNVHDVRPINVREVRHEDIVDPGFAGGLSPKEYLEKRWEGDLE